MPRLKETVQKNQVNAPVIFIGCGGIGSKIIAGVAHRAIHDDTSNMRFVVMDTDVNDISKVDKGANIIAVQTSSTATIENYLKNDEESKTKWFPVNKMLDSKPVSEGAGQVRAISRLALNATIKQGKIMDLYNAIDGLFLKDGGKFKQAVKIVIASTAAGGTGSGIAMEVGMLVRNYIKKNYPEAAAMIRGFLILPGVMDTVIDTQSEKDSIRCNGYATLKEINAFMMKGSGFFDTVPELQRYRDLCVTVPNATSGIEKLSCLPFDFCFLLDRADSNSGIMPSMAQYISSAAQAIYEQNIGPMSFSSSSKEDNILKLCIRPETLGRCRFGGIGSAQLIYPYESVRDYIALNWARTAIIGSTAKGALSEAERLKLIQGSWLQYDIQYADERKKYEENPAGSDEPILKNVYVRAMTQGKDGSSGNNFTSSLWNKYLIPKILEIKKAVGGKVTENSKDNPDILSENHRAAANSSTQKVARNYIATIIQEVISNHLNFYDSTFLESYELIQQECQKDVAGKSHQNKYTAIQSVAEIIKNGNVEKAATDLANAICGSTASANNDRLGKHMLEKFISVKGKVMHPNAIRFMLYELSTFIDATLQTFKSGADDYAYMNRENVHCNGASDEGGKADKKEFDVPGIKARGKETNLEAMCKSCDAANYYTENQYGQACEDKLTAYAKDTINYLIYKIGYSIYNIMMPALNELLKSFESFYGTFKSKVPAIEKAKEDIITSLKFEDGDYVYNLFHEKDVMDRISDMNATPTESSEASSELYATIYDNVRDNAYKIARTKYNPYEFAATKDIFFDVIVPYFSRMVEDGVTDIQVDNILLAIQLECRIKNNIAVENTTPALREAKYRDLETESTYSKYISDTIEMCKNLASPGIMKNTHDEAREVSAIAYSAAMRDSGGIRVSDFLKDQVKTDTVSAYELHFFRSVYNITPLQLSKFAAPSEDDFDDQFSLSTQGELDLPSAGDYFRIYQKYMDSIGPDSRTSAIITPHIDQRWNAISVLPELDMEYQKKLMSKIHKSMIYGFIYDRIRMRPTSDDDDADMIYVYYDNKEVRQGMKVSNGTKCDSLYEVLDCLYFDRQAVSTIRDFVNAQRVKIRDNGCTTINDSDFFRALKTLCRGDVICKSKEPDELISLFEIVLLYCNSLPAQGKDISEMRVMINAVIEIIEAEIKNFTADPDTVYFRTSEQLLNQYKLLIKNYTAHRDFLRIGLFSDDVIETAKSSIIHYYQENDLLKYVDKIKESDRK